MKEKLDDKLDTNEITQTRYQTVEVSAIASAPPGRAVKVPFKDRSIEAIKKVNIEFDKSRFKWFSFDISKGSSLKGLKLRVSKKENILEDVDKSICKVDLPAYDNRVKFILDKILNSNNIDKLKKYLSIEFKNYQPPKKYIKVSRTI